MGGSEKNVLLVRHLPDELTTADKQSLLQHFGAVGVKCLSNKGCLRHTAFATFEDEESAENALSRLHQLKVMGRTLVVEFAKTQQQKDMAAGSLLDNQKKPDDENREDVSKEKDVEDVAREKARKLKGQILSASSGLGLDFPINPKLYYKYPQPTVGILANIINALVSVPKFYTQVLHLMNKMNLPAPFGPVTQTPPIPTDAPAEQPPEPDEMEIASSTEESELESDGEHKQKKEKVKPSIKRRSQARFPRAKKMKLQVPSAGLVKALTAGTATVTAKPQDVFDQQLPATTIKKLEMKLPQSLSDILEAHTKKTAVTTNVDESTTSVGFGVMKATAKETEELPSENESSDDDNENEVKEFISSRELRKNRISSKEMESMSVFKKYNAGEPTTRLYIKNLNKQCEQKDLKFIYGRYVDWDSKMDQDMFSIQLMTQGRMKGQAFVSLPSEFAAKKAVKDTNGYQLLGKPIVVQFARSSKPKEPQTSKTT
ncbi:RNA-binding region-containing protein 3-like isoform X2 [Antedon mediterranea]|uniref:RNA-binding region-containing protein 3-like isoform X2 n=1 Tax=Antedon mediterranea TaxID=105859 RepID=UPI003AF4E2BC